MCPHKCFGSEGLQLSSHPPKAAVAGTAVSFLNGREAKPHSPTCFAQPASPLGLTGANFTGAGLNGTKFTSANLQEANFTQAGLNGTNFTSANLQREC